MITFKEFLSIFDSVFEIKFISSLLNKIVPLSISISKFISTINELDEIDSFWPLIVKPLLGIKISLYLFCPKNTSSILTFKGLISILSAKLISKTFSIISIVFKFTSSNSKLKYWRSCWVTFITSDCLGFIVKSIEDWQLNVNDVKDNKPFIKNPSLAINTKLYEWGFSWSRFFETSKLFIVSLSCISDKSKTFWIVEILFSSIFCFSVLKSNISSCVRCCLLISSIGFGVISKLFEKAVKLFDFKEVRLPLISNPCFAVKINSYSFSSNNLFLWTWSPLIMVSILLLAISKTFLIVISFDSFISSGS